jgi:hypothetical protein
VKMGKVGTGPVRVLELAGWLVRLAGEMGDLECVVGAGPRRSPCPYVENGTDGKTVVRF